MKFAKFIFTIVVLLYSVIQSNAQTFTMDTDTSKAYWFAPGYGVQINKEVVGTTDTPIYIIWRIVYYEKGPGWTFEGICDNANCRAEGTEGMVSGSKSFATDKFTSTKKLNFSCTWGADSAALGTGSKLTIEMISGITKKYGSFKTYKMATGIANTFRLEEDLTIFPNPATNYIDVAYSESSDVKTITIYNLLGKLISVYKPSDKQSAHCELNTDMPSGIYLVRVADSKGNVIATRKITHQ